MSNRDTVRIRLARISRVTIFLVMQLELTNQLGQYEFLRLLKKQGIRSSWTAIRKPSGAKVFLKVFEISDDAEALVDLLTNSHQLQRQLRLSSILNSTTLTRTNQFLVIEYPLLDISDWILASTITDPRILQDVLVFLATTLDVLHLKGLVHCDVKLSNVLFKNNNGVIQLKLIDTDFMTSQGEDLRNQLVGTPEHIPHEIYHSGKALIQSDNYSLGISLMKHIRALAQSTESDQARFHKLVCFSHMLTFKEPERRPSSLLNALHSSELISEQLLQQELFRALSRFISLQVRALKGKDVNSSHALHEFLTNQCRLLGLLPDHSSSIFAILENSFSKAFRVLSFFLRSSRIELMSDFFMIRSTDEVRLKLYTQTRTRNYNTNRKQDDSHLTEHQYLQRKLTG